jgi:hypothetical protein
MNRFPKRRAGHGDLTSGGRVRNSADYAYQAATIAAALLLLLTITAV